MTGIYQIKNKINGKSYVGKSIRIEERFSDHKNWAFNSNSKKYMYPLYQAFRKYGINNFDFIVLEECLENELHDKECFYYNLLKPKYCLTDPNLNSFSQSIGVGKKISEALTGRMFSDEHKKNISKALMGSKNPQAKKVIAINKKTSEETEFDCYGDAAEWIMEKELSISNRRQITQSISRVATGQRKSAYGFYWTN